MPFNILFERGTEKSVPFSFCTREGNDSSLVGSVDSVKNANIWIMQGLCVPKAVFFYTMEKPQQRRLIKKLKISLEVKIILPIFVL